MSDNFKQIKDLPKEKNYIGNYVDIDFAMVLLVKEYRT